MVLPDRFERWRAWKSSRRPNSRATFQGLDQRSKIEAELKMARRRGSHAGHYTRFDDNRHCKKILLLIICNRDSELRYFLFILSIIQWHYLGRCRTENRLFISIDIQIKTVNHVIVSCVIRYICDVKAVFFTISSKMKFSIWNLNFLCWIENK